jgi:hypothetical protein
MIYEPKDINYQDVINRETSKAIVHCGHDDFFWKSFKKGKFGDVVYCSRCARYFAKIKHLPWVVRTSFEPHSNHLSSSFLVTVHPRITL